MFRIIRQIMRLDAIAASQDALKADIHRLTERMEANYADLRRDYLELSSDLESSHQDREQRVTIAIAKMNGEIKLQSDELRKTAAALLDRMSTGKAVSTRSKA